MDLCCIRLPSLATVHWVAMHSDDIGGARKALKLDDTRHELPYGGKNYSTQVDL